ncbi:hypothetical protein SCHPADRAFT_929062 [Schizopora paradoxa]|uniref:Uncharacterized protein n=1 Tax=Schizopora paradoxa TaxID=27342 RepID=A0A0H2RL98_9AGAM|nr:hypothetical protein SCHPADRAFT_929062 [Schizopora paradoxa]
MASTSKAPVGTVNVPPLSLEEEDALIHARITNDERPLRRLTKKFHTYMSVAYPPIVDPPPSTTSSVEEAREAFEIELASFKLLLRKTRMVCEAESRQQGVYRTEKDRIAHEHEVLKNQIEELKMALEQAQVDRRRKVEYDAIAEKINTLSSRAELENSIAEIESDMQVIRVEHESQNRSIHARKVALDTIVSDLKHLRILGKETAAAVAKGESAGPQAISEPASPAPPISAVDSTMHVDGEDGSQSPTEEKQRDEKDGETPSRATLAVPQLNPTAKPFATRRSTPLLHTATHQLRLQNSTSMESNLGADMGGMAGTPSESREATPAPPPLTPTQTQDNLDLPTTSREESPAREDGEEKEDPKEDEREEGEEHEDIEMGELSEGNGRSRKSLAEDREEGEASDFGSELSELPEED